MADEQVERATLPPTAAATTAEQPWPVRLLSAKISEYVSKMSTVWVEGQVVQATLRPGTSMAFLTLRDVDVDMSLPVTARAHLLKAFPDGLREGARVVVRATPEFWTKRGTLQLTASEIRAVGIGELLARIEHLKRVLAAEGLLDASRKKPLPFLPGAVGLVCGRGSAAERDVVVTATTRWPGVRFVLRQVAVQGPQAVSQVGAAVRELDADPEVDVIVVARGGGSLEDLLPFSDEGLVRLVAACTTPVVSAIGHEVDNPLLDLVADVRASTPTDAGRRVVPAVAEELAGVEAARRRLRQAVERRVEREVTGLAQLRSRPVLADPARLVAVPQQQLDDDLGRVRRALDGALARDQGRLDALVAGVRALSPAAVLDRGYAVVQALDADVDGADRGAPGAGPRVVRSPDDVRVGGSLRVRLAHGEITAEVTGLGAAGRTTPVPDGDADPDAGTSTATGTSASASTGTGSSTGTGDDGGGGTGTGDLAEGAGGDLSGVAGGDLGGGAGGGPDGDDPERQDPVRESRARPGAGPDSAAPRSTAPHSPSDDSTEETDDV